MAKLAYRLPTITLHSITASPFVSLAIHLKHNPMWSTLACWVIQLKPIEAKDPIITRGMQQELCSLALWAGIYAATRDVRAASWTQCDSPDSSNGYGSAVPAVRVFVDGGWERGDVELVGILTIECPWCTFCLIDVEVELKLAPVCAVGRYVKGDLGVSLELDVRLDTIMWKW
jgi:hypothetical protein